MKKLKLKVFTVIFAILSAIALGVCFVSFLRTYYGQKKEIQNILNIPTIDNETIIEQKTNSNENKEQKEPTKKDDIKNPERIFLNYTVYTVILSIDDNLEVINHTGNEQNEELIKKIAEKIITNHKTENHVGNLFINKYSYAFKRNGTLIIIDNSDLNSELIKSLIFTLLMICILEIIIWIITSRLTCWIIKPVEESFERQKRFIADASHELKTPLTIMIASSEAFYKDGKKKWVDNMRSESERMTALVTDLLDLSQIENEKNLNFKLEDLSNLIESSILTFESLFYESKLKLEYNIEKDIKLNCNKNQIKQLITILVDNAIKHSEPKATVFIILKKEGKEILLEVKNKGEEIPKKEEDKIFERFYKMDTSRNRNSNNYGLGLAIAKSIVENHNGSITANSESGYTVFKITWPQVKN